jgi:hypothetical protein
MSTTSRTSSTSSGTGTTGQERPHVRTVPLLFPACLLTTVSQDPDIDFPVNVAEDVDFASNTLTRPQSPRLQACTPPSHPDSNRSALAALAAHSHHHHNPGFEPMAWTPDHSQSSSIRSTESRPKKKGSTSTREDAKGKARAAAVGQGKKNDPKATIQDPSARQRDLQEFVVSYLSRYPDDEDIGLLSKLISGRMDVPTLSQSSGYDLSRGIEIPFGTAMRLIAAAKEYPA